MDKIKRLLGRKEASCNDKAQIERMQQDTERRLRELRELQADNRWDHLNPSHPHRSKH